MRGRSWILIGAAAVGAALLRRFGLRREQEEQRRAIDEVEEAGLESFPASDPPSWTLGDRDEA